MYKWETMKKRITCWILICGLLLAWGGSPCTVRASSSGITSDSIREKENKIAEVRKEQKKLKSSLSDLEKIKKNLESQKASLASYIRELDASLMQIEQNIVELKQRISAKEEEIRLTQQELEEAQEREEFQKESVTACIRFIYETDSPGMVELLLKSKNFGDFLNKADYVEKVLNYGHQMWKNYKTVREYVELCKAQLEAEKELLDETRDSVEQEQRNLEELIEQKNRDLNSYAADINNKEKAIKEYEEEIKAQEEEIKLLEAAIAEEKKKLTYDGGVFKFPLASFTRISDEFGTRMDPFLGVQKFHSGVDFAAPKGTAIYAAYDGQVVAATYSSSMGNYVMIDHGDGLYTIYMHASALYVKKGDMVSRGDTIAAVGSTGRSTGNHLHFSVRLNGEYVSPWNYLSR